MAQPRRANALLMIDVINDLDFPGSRALVKDAEAMAERLDRLATRARRAGIPVIYVNDNFGRWQSDWRTVVERCVAKDVPGHRVSERLRPTPDDYFVLKPKHSGFFSTPLEVLLRYLGAQTLILTGLAADICILSTANDAYMRDYEIVVPRDCVAANTRRKTAFALRQIREVRKGSTPASASIRFRVSVRAAVGSGARPRAAARVLGSRSRRARVRKN
jgi:nicotinamidase-related amidase